MHRLIFIFLFPAISNGVVIRHDVAIEAYRELAAIEAFAGVAQVRVGMGFGGRSGSGVVINDRWLLTAGHVVWGMQASEVEIRIGASSIRAEEIRYPAAWSISPQSGLTQGSDLALVRFATNSGVTSTEIASAVSSGQTAFLGGFGRTGNGILGAAGSAELLFAMNVIDRQISTSNGGGFLVTDFDDGTVAKNSLNSATTARAHYNVGFASPTLTSTILDVSPLNRQATFLGLPTASDFFPGLVDEFLEGTTAGGDSGGPLFVFDESSGQWAVAGITSWGINPLLADGFSRTDSRYGDLAFFTDLTANKEWIIANIPEPSFLWLMTIFSGLAFFRRTRSF